MTERNDKRLIEVQLPLEKISSESRRDKNIRKGHISTMHHWWARRPLPISRVGAYASLVPDPGEETREQKIEFIKNLSTWEATTDKQLLSQAEDDIVEEFDGEHPRVLDPFSGGGALPLEAQRIGCESYGLDYNPVAHILNKAVLEYPHVHNQTVEEDTSILSDSRHESETIPIVEYVSKWAEQVLSDVEDEIGDLFSESETGYVWMRTVPCQTPNCNLQIPLFRNKWLDKKQTIIFEVNADKSGEFKTKIRRKGEISKIGGENKKTFEIEESGKQIVPSNGTVRQGTVTCPACENSFKSDKTQEIGREQGFGYRMVFVLEQDEDDNKKYRHPNSADLEAVEEAEARLEQVKDELIPNEEIPYHADAGRYLTPRIYGYESWGAVFNPRQKLVLATFCSKIRDLEDKISSQNEELVKPVMTYLTLVVGKMANRNSKFSVWGDQRIKPTFPNGYFPMEWDYVESNPFSGWTGSWTYSLDDYILEAIKTCTTATGDGTASLGDATRLSYPDNHFDAVFTDPPYYDNIPYSYLSDFFYVWMKRALGEIFPDVFITPTTPKTNEIIEDRTKHDDSETAEEFYEDMLSQSFKEINRVLRCDGIATIVFAHKDTDAWAQMIRSLLSSNLVVTATWPVHTERHNRPRSIESAALASSVYFICRIQEGEKVGYFDDVRDELEERIHERLDYFWNQGVRGADLIVSAIGPAVEVFGQYESVERLSGESITVDELLEMTQRMVSDYALEKVLSGEVNLENIDPETRFYILYRWAFANQKEDYDEVNKLAQVNGAEPSILENVGIMSVSRGDARLQPPQQRDIDDPANVPDKNGLTLIDKIQRAAILWEDGRRDDLKQYIERHGMSDEFWRATQAIAECLPEDESRSQKEKQMLHGLLQFQNQTEFRPSEGQSHIDEYVDEEASQGAMDGEEDTEDEST